MAEVRIKPELTIHRPNFYGDSWQWEVLAYVDGDALIRWGESETEKEAIKEGRAVLKEMRREYRNVLNVRGIEETGWDMDD